MWTLPLLIVALALGLAVPLGLYMARLFDGRYQPPSWLSRLEATLDTGGMTWKQYALALVAFNALIFALGFIILVLQPWLPLNPDNKGMLAPSTIFHTACSFLTNTNQQHYSGEVHLSYFSQLFFICWKQFITPAIGLAALVAIIRGLRGDGHLGNFYLDLWRGLVYVLLPLALVVGLLCVLGGVPMTLEGAAKVKGLEGAEQEISRGPVAAVVAIKQLGTNGGGYFGANGAHPFENPSSWTNVLLCVSIVLLPMASVVMFGRMIQRFREAGVIGGVMLTLMLLFLACAVPLEAGQPNPGLAGLPVTGDLGNLEGHELRFGRGAGPTWAVITTCTSNGSVNCMHDSMHPLVGAIALAGMWLNCIWGGVGVGLINLFVYLITGVFLAGLMVGRTPEYLGKKVEAREMKLAMLALLIHPLLVLAPTGLFVATEWGRGAMSNPGPHGFSQVLYEFTSASANNGSGFEGLQDTQPARFAWPWDVACGIVLILGRFVPIIAPLALVGSLAAKKQTPLTSGTLRTDTPTFAFVLLGTILLVGALLFLPAAMLGPIAEHLGPMPFGR